MSYFLLLGNIIDQIYKTDKPLISYKKDGGHMIIIKTYGDAESEKRMIDDLTELCRRHIARKEREKQQQNGSFLSVTNINIAPNQYNY